jgi:hemerythrin-like domain-containing protein
LYVGGARRRGREGKGAEVVGGSADESRTEGDGGGEGGGGGGGGGHHAREGDDGPLDLLERSHRRLEERLAVLQSAASAIVRERAGVTELTAIDSVLGFLERSAARHEEDEEESLFPRLRGVPELRPLLDDLAADHLLHRHLLKQLRSLHSGWPETGPDASDGAALAILANELTRAYRTHIEREERELMPAARERLGPAEREGIRIEMSKRRSGEEGRGHGTHARRRYPAGSTGPRIREM